MGCFQAEQPLLGEKGISPALMIDTATSTPQSKPLAEDRTQSHSKPSVQVVEQVIVVAAVLKVLEPAAKRAVHVVDDVAQALTAATTAFLAANRVFELLQTLLMQPSFISLDRHTIHTRRSVVTSDSAKGGS